MAAQRSAAIITFILTISFPIVCLSIRPLPLPLPNQAGAVSAFPHTLRFTEAPEYRNGIGCPTTSPSPTVNQCDPALVHVSMTLDYEYLRGSMAAVHSVLKHATCPENIFFHFITAEFDSLSPRVLSQLVRSTFPSLNYKVYIFREDAVINLISSSVRHALENPLNYARNYIGDILDTCVSRAIYLDSDVVLVDDIIKLWNITFSGAHVIGAPEYCHANFTSYFTDLFWSDSLFKSTFSARPRPPCYFNTGVMVMDLTRWRAGNYRGRIEKWMEIQKKRRIYDLGSLPPFLLEFAGDVEGIDHRWNQHGLGGDNVRGSCRPLHAGPVSLLHWSGKGKPWVRVSEGRPCPLDHLWVPYDLFDGGRERGLYGDTIRGSGFGRGSLITWL
ncbi:hypothetical protein vseg_015068 [Gypsophila vaccaria]